MSTGDPKSLRCRKCTRATQHENTLPNDPIGGTIGAAQFNQWRAHFGQAAGSGAGAIANAAVPEPPTLVTLLVGMLAAYARRRTLVA